jgi:hypothetical protein
VSTNETGQQSNFNFGGAIGTANGPTYECKLEVQSAAAGNSTTRGSRTF